MVRFVSSFVEDFREFVDPSYLEAKEEMKKNLRTMGLVATGTLVASFALTFFGAALTTSGFGAPIIFVSLPLGYSSYNCYKISENLYDIIENPTEYQKFTSLSVDKQKIKKKLGEGTFCFSWIIDLAVDEAIKSAQKRV